MKLAPLLTIGIVALGWAGVAMFYGSTAHAATMKLTPAYHDPYDARDIDEEIAFHQLRVKNDPKGAIGYKMLSGAWLARSRESDLDTAAWKAEDAARKSLALRHRNNDDAQVKLVQSMLEQHRFQDALVEARKIVAINPESKEGPKLVVDCLTEIGRYDEAFEALSQIPIEPKDYALVAIRARLESAVGRHGQSLALYRKARAIAVDLPTVSQSSLAWFDTKIGGELEALGQIEDARDCFAMAFRLYPNSYKAALGLGRCALASGDMAAAERWGKETLRIANSVDAKSILFRVASSRNSAEAKRIADGIRDQFREEVATFDKAGKGGSYRVRPIDRQFATFASETGLFRAEAMVAAKRDFANRPDSIAKRNLTALR